MNREQPWTQQMRMFPLLL